MLKTLNLRLGSLACLAGLGLAAMTLGGCTGSNNALLEANRALQDRNTALTQENQSLQRANQELQGGLSSRERAIAELQALINDLRSQGGNNSSTIASLEERLRSMQFGPINVALDSATDAALRNLAAQHSDMLEYDPATGALRFKSDVLFDSGRDTVKEAAKPTLRQFAQILNSTAAQYDVRIVGHTDSQPIRAAAARHPTNMHLACHRAISVRGELVNSAVAPERCEAAGRGEFDPIVANSASGNTPRNRRVEVFLTKPIRSLGAGGASSAAPASAPAAAPVAPARPAVREEIMK